MRRGFFSGDRLSRPGRGLALPAERRCACVSLGCLFPLPSRVWTHGACAQVESAGRRRADPGGSSCACAQRAEKLILHIQKHSIPFALATSSGTESYQAKTSAHRELFGAFHHVVLGDDPEVKASKPAPDIFLACAHRFSGHLPGLHPQCLVLEDTPHGMAVAQAAGMQVVMVPSVQLDPELNGRGHPAAALLG
ncbi:pseudouridine-5'-phosphatase-like [Dipodomys merriami]|uniref:pseudouridine-5'-phosphatase-like n=1 Tax=Dipodomys merriami TaxID=94247 RepID=UPI003855E0D0